MRSCSAMRKAPLRALRASGSACSKAPMAERSSSTRSGELSARAQAKVLRVLQEGRDSPHRRELHEAVRCAAGRGDQSRAARRSRRRPVPSGPAVSPRRHSHQRAAAPRAHRGHSAARRAVLAAVGRAHRQQSGARAERGFARSRGMIGLATFESCKTCSRRSSSRFRRAASSGASELPAAIARAAQLSSHESLESARLKFEERFVRAALARAAGHRGQTAAALGLSRQGLAKLMQRLHLDA